MARENRGRACLTGNARDGLGWLDQRDEAQAATAGGCAASWCSAGAGWGDCAWKDVADADAVSESRRSSAGPGVESESAVGQSVRLLVVM